MAKPQRRPANRARAQTETQTEATPRRQRPVSPQQAAGDDDHAPGPSLRKAQEQDDEVRTGGARRGARKPRAVAGEASGPQSSRRRSKPSRKGRGTRRTRAGALKSVRGRRSTRRR